LYAVKGPAKVVYKLFIQHDLIMQKQEAIIVVKIKDRKEHRRKKLWKLTQRSQSAKQVPIVPEGSLTHYYII
jgi:hypothetical protein